MKKFSPVLKHLVRGLPLAGAAGASLLPLRELSRQFMVLIVLLWLQAFLLLEVFLAGR